VDKADPTIFEQVDVISTEVFVVVVSGIGVGLGGRRDMEL
jgi:hypothetical protein